MRPVNAEGPRPVCVDVLEGGGPLTRPGSVRAGENWVEFPRIRQALQRWTMLAGGGCAETVGWAGLSLGKVIGCDADPVRSALDYLRSHRIELIVLAAHQRTGLEGWIQKATAEPIALGSGEMTLFVPEGVVEPRRARPASPAEPAR